MVKMVKIDRLLLCSCAKSMTIDAATAQKATEAAQVKTCNALCTTDMDIASAALAQEGTTLIACAQQRRLFEDLHAEIDGKGTLMTADIRDRAGWTAKGDAHPKQAALLAEAVLDRPNTPLRDMYSNGVCLILGDAATALPAAEQLCDTLSVTCLLSGPTDDIVPTDRYDVAQGSVTNATGAFTKFEVTVDGYAPLSPQGRGTATFGSPTNGAKSHCDIILDLSGADPLCPAPEKRDGYVRADPKNPAQVQTAIHQASHLIGEFDKPLYVRFDPSICAHSRASQTGCNRCLNVCPTGAITPNGDTVLIDPDICAGCGACASVCPSGAASYDTPPVEFLFARLRSLASAFKEAGGTAPVALFHDTTFGREMIQIAARFSKGLPAHVIPVDVANVESIGHAETLAALAVGFAGVTILTSPKSDRDVIEGQLELARAVMGGTGHDPSLVTLLDARDPEQFEDALYASAPDPLAIETILPLGNRRDVSRLSALALNGEPATIALPTGAPYGAIEIDTDTCTLCLACVSLCPVGALMDNPDKPQVTFQEAACLQCGICKSTCPENAITLKPQLNLENAALSPRMLNEEEPFDCISCGTPFGVKSTIDRIINQLKDKHPMFTASDNFKLIQMCDDCRVNAQYHQEGSPFKSADRPKTRTTQDYLDARKKH